MSNDTTMPVSVSDLRSALALCKAKFEGNAATFRERARLDGEHLSKQEPFYTLEAESCDRMASSVGAVLRAPDSMTAGEAELSKCVGELTWRYQNCPQDIDSLFEAWADSPFVAEAFDRETIAQES